MCVVSMVGDHYKDKWGDQEWWKRTYPSIPPFNPNTPSIPQQLIPSVSRAEFEELKREVEEMKKLLIRAAEYDKRNNEPNCEMEDKVALLKKVAEMVGVDLKEVFGEKND